MARAAAVCCIFACYKPWPHNLHIVNADSNIVTIILVSVIYSPSHFTTALHLEAQLCGRCSVQSPGILLCPADQGDHCPAPGAAPHWSLTPRCAASHWSISRGGVRQWPGDVEHKHWPALQSIGDSLHPLPFVLWTLPSIQPVF